MKSSLLCALASLALAGEAGAQACVWGSFDGTRINYPGGVLTTGADHSSLRGLITGLGATLAPATPTLTPAYLAGVDIFYTSLLHTATGALAPAEQAALQSWIASGGTLIVTGDIFPLPAYESFTAFYGLTNWTALGNNATGFVTVTHGLTTAVTTYTYATESTFTYGSDALLLGATVLGDDFMVVMEPLTGFTAGGRILVFGDHNMFTNALIGATNNTRLATNMVSWACIPWPTQHPVVCFGDGSGTPCPCGNAGSAGAGCANSVGGGAVLSASGFPRTTATALTFTCSGVRTQPGLVFQAANVIGGGNGLPFGDGLRCCGGMVLRLPILDPPPQPEPITISFTLGSVPPGVNPGDMRCYQYWYRDPGGPCSQGFNLSNAVSVIWTP